ncbi:MAG: serine/threonine-protein kinase [Planctomycetota bacterium]
MTQDRSEEIDALVLRYLDRTDGTDEPPTEVLDRLCADHPEMADELRASVRVLGGMGMLDGSTDDPSDRVGPYRLGRRLGTGGMGVVHVAWRDGSDVPVALKLLRADQGLEPGVLERFAREVEAASRLDHPGIVRVVDSGGLVRTEDGAPPGQPYVALEFHGGGTLERVTRAQAGRDPLTLTGADLLASLDLDAAPHALPSPLRGEWWRIVVTLVREVAVALAHAHTRGVVHRDVKPSNVLVTPEGRVLLLDFGLAALRGSSRLTATGVQLGSLPYMAPEQIRGRTQADDRADIYSLAATAYELLTLRLPFIADDPEKLGMKILDGGITPPSKLLRGLPADVALALDAVLGCAMEREPRHRYASAEAFAADLTSVLRGRPVAARPPSTIERTARWVRRRPFVATTIALIALIGVGAPAAYGFLEARHAREIERSVDATLGQLSNLLAAVETNVDSLAVGALHADERVALRRFRTLDEALSILQAAERDSASILSTSTPETVLLRREIQAAKGNLLAARGGVLSVLERYDEADAAFREVETLSRAMLEWVEDPVPFQHGLGHSLVRQVHVLHRRGHDDTDLDLAREGIEWIERAARAGYATPASVKNRAVAHIELAEAYARAGDPTAAAAALERVLELLDGIEAQGEGTFVTEIRRGLTLIELAEIGEEEAPGSGEDLLVAASAAVEAALRVAPEDPWARALQIMTELAWADSYRHLEDFETALVRASRARQLCESVLAIDPGDVVVQEQLESAIGLEAYLRSQSEGPDATALREAVDEARDHHLDDPDHLNSAIVLCERLINLANFLTVHTKPGDDEVLAEAEELILEALAVIESVAARASTQNVVRSRTFGNYSLAVARAKRDDVAGADEAIARLLAAANERMPRHARMVADAHAERMLALMRTTAGREAIDAARDATLSALEQAVEVGYGDLEEIRTNPALDPLRGEARLEALLRRL